MGIKAACVYEALASERMNLMRYSCMKGVLYYWAMFCATGQCFVQLGNVLSNCWKSYEPYVARINPFKLRDFCNMSHAFFA